MTATVIAGRGIVTPQGVVLDLETAGVGHRGLARIIDLVIVLAVLFVIVTLGDFIGSSAGGETVGLIFSLVIGFVWAFGYPVVSETFFRGRTVGKMTLGLRVVTLEAGPVGIRESSIRSLFQIIDLSATRRLSRLA